jgi:plastocyanin
MRWMAAAGACAALGLAGCGSGNDGSSPSGGGGGLDISAPADGAKKFTKTELTASAGKITVKFDNPASIPHGVTIEGNGVDAASDVVTGSNTSLTVDLKPGKYTFYCPVGDHRAEGMQGTLTVS